MDMHTELKAVPHAGLGFHFLRVPVGNQRILGVFKRKSGPKRKETNDDRGSNRLTAVRARLQNSLALYQKIGVKACQRHNQAGTSRRRPFRISATLQPSSLGNQLQRGIAPLLHNEETKAKTIRKDPCDSKGYTHTHIFRTHNKINMIEGGAS